MMKEVLDELRAQQKRLIAEMAEAKDRVARITDLIARLMLAREQAERKVLGVASLPTPDEPANGGAA